jgi:hypothetical protein
MLRRSGAAGNFTTIPDNLLTVFPPEHTVYQAEPADLFIG